MEQPKTDNNKNYQQSSANHYEKCRNVKGKKSPWLTREIKTEMNNRDHRLMRKCRHSKRTTEYEKFKQQRNKVNNLVRKANNHYHKDKLRESVHNPKGFWSTLKSLFPLKEKISSAKSFIINGKLNSTAKDIN